MEHELGKTEELNQGASSAELSELETASMPTEVEDTPMVVTAEDPADTTSASADSADASQENGAQAAAVEVNGLKRGMVLEGIILRATPTEVAVDLGEGREGIVKSSELERMTKKMIDELVAGSRVPVFVVNARNQRGETLLSIINALEEIDWKEAESFYASKEVYDAKVSGYNKGGLIVRFGRLRGFVPQSQLSDVRSRETVGETPEEKYGRQVGTDIAVKVMEVDRVRNRLILSERAAMREVRQRRKESLINNLAMGDEREGRVVSLENFGAFVDVGGAEGLVHVTEISHNHLTHPRQALQVGQTVKVKVISVDPDNNRIGLSIRALLADPWQEIAQRYPEGTLVRGVVTKLANFGAFARVEGEDDIEGLIHVSELSDKRIEKPGDAVKKGDVLTLRVVKVDPQERRLGLSLRAVLLERHLDADMAFAFSHPDAAYVPMPEARKGGRVRETIEKVKEAAAELAAEVREEVQEFIAEAREEIAEVRAKLAGESHEDAAEASAQVSEAVADESHEDAAEASAHMSEAVADESHEDAAEASAQVSEAVADESQETAAE